MAEIQRLEQIAQTVRDTNTTITQLQSTINSLQSELINLKGSASKDVEMARMRYQELNKRISEMDRWNEAVRTLNEIPGVRTPRWYEVDVFFDRNDSNLRFNSTEISPDGPFIITQMQVYYTYSDTTEDANVTGGAPVTGRTVPCTAYPFLLGSFGQEAGNANFMLGNLTNSATGAPAPLAAIPEFSFQIEIAGSGRFWTNQSIPAAAFYGLNAPLYSGIAGWVERTDRIVVHCTPDIPVPLEGRVRMVFHGYQILGHIKIGEALGY